MRTFRDIAEGVQKASDDKIDAIIKNDFNGKAVTYDYNAEASMELGKLFNKVLITKDKLFIHIPNITKESQVITDKFNLKEIK